MILHLKKSLLTVAMHNTFSSKLEIVLMETQIVAGPRWARTIIAPYFLLHKIKTINIIFQSQNSPTPNFNKVSFAHFDSWDIRSLSASLFGCILQENCKFWKFFMLVSGNVRRAFGVLDARTLKTNLLTSLQLKKKKKKKSSWQVNFGLWILRIPTSLMLDRNARLCFNILNRSADYNWRIHKSAKIKILKIHLTKQALNIIKIK